MRLAVTRQTRQMPWRSDTALRRAKQKYSSACCCHSSLWTAEYGKVRPAWLSLHNLLELLQASIEQAYHAVCTLQQSCVWTLSRQVSRVRKVDELQVESWLVRA